MIRLVEVCCAFLNRSSIKLAVFLDLDRSSYGDHYGSGYMQKNPSYNQGSTHNSYSYRNPTFGLGTSSKQRNYPEDSTSSGYLGDEYHYSGWLEFCMQSLNSMAFVT